MWQDGINFVMKVAGKDRLVAIEAPASGGEGCVAGEDGDDSGGRVADVDLREVVGGQGGEGDRDARLGGAGEVAGQAGETGENIMLLFPI